MNIQKLTLYSSFAFLLFFAPVFKTVAMEHCPTQESINKCFSGADRIDIWADLSKKITKLENRTSRKIEKLDSKVSKHSVRHDNLASKCLLGDRSSCNKLTKIERKLTKFISHITNLEDRFNRKLQKLIQTQTKRRVIADKTRLACEQLAARAFLCR